MVDPTAIPPPPTGTEVPHERRHGPHHHARSRRDPPAPQPRRRNGDGVSEVSSEPDLLRYLSASRLKCWQSCRRQFYYRYVERLVVPTAPALFIGRQIHEVLRQWNWASGRTSRSLPSSFTPP
jgi:hypothetical protein